MTLLAFALYDDRAELLTDTLSYSLNVSSLGHHTKLMPLTHLDCVIATAGAHEFGTDVRLGLAHLGAKVETFDDLVEHTPAVLRALHEDAPALTCSTVFLLGYSPAAERFTAHVYANDDDFTPLQVTRPWVMPAPWVVRPTDLEVSRLKAQPDDGSFERLGEQDAETWQARPPLDPPADVDEWIMLAELARAHRALDGPFHTCIGGQLLLTRIWQGAQTTERVGVFNDTGEEFLKLVQWTRHPLAQEQPCWCGSGHRFVECALRDEWGEPCLCKSGLTFRDCCRIPADETAPHVHDATAVQQRPLPEKEQA